MKYQDRIHGEVEIKEPVLLELINCPAIQRLKEIDCAGYMGAHFPDVQKTRFHHSMGVFLILRRFGASIEEQIAGLIHDVSHSAFSHCVDYALAAGSGKKQSHQDNVFDEFVRQTEIPQILQKHDIDTDYILDETNFPLEENDIPDICADRLDYSLREGEISGKMSRKQVNKILDNLKAENSQWIFQDFAVAADYARLFSKLNNTYWSGLPSAVMFITVGNYLKRALAKKYITVKDLYATDKHVLEKINKHLDKDQVLAQWWKHMNAPTRFFTSNPQDYDEHVFVKSRVIDPLFKDEENIKRVSQRDQKWGYIVKKELKPKEYFVKFAE